MGEIRECGKGNFKGNAGIWETADRSSNLIGFGQILDKYLNNKIGYYRLDYLILIFFYELDYASIIYWRFSYFISFYKFYHCNNLSEDDILNFGRKSK